MGFQPKITVITPVYQVREDWLRASLESIGMQTFPDFEYVIVDDGSQDHSYDVCNEYAKQDSRIRLHRLEQNQGIAAAMNYGVNVANAPWIAIHDGDDLSHPERLAKQYNFLLKHPETVLLGTNMDLCFEYGVSDTVRESATNFINWYNSIDNVNIQSQMMKGSCVANGTAIFSKQHALTVGLYNQQYRQLLDWEFFLRLMSVGNIKKLPERLYTYRRHSESYCYQADTSDLFGKIHAPYINRTLPLDSTVAIWGTGGGGVGFLSAWGSINNARINLRHVIDGSGAMVGQVINGYTVRSRKALAENKVDYILIAVSVSKYIEDIKKDLYVMGYTDNQIIELYPSA